MVRRFELTRRALLKGVDTAGALACAGRWIEVGTAVSSVDPSTIFMVDECPLHGGGLRHVGIDTLLDLAAAGGNPQKSEN